MKAITVIISCGGVTQVLGLPPDYKLVIQDYDAPPDWEDLKTDGDGCRYQEIVIDKNGDCE